MTKDQIDSEWKRKKFKPGYNNPTCSNWGCLVEIKDVYYSNGNGDGKEFAILCLNCYLKRDEITWVYDKLPPKPDTPSALTDEMVLLLEMLIENPIRSMYEVTLKPYQSLIAMGYMEETPWRSEAKYCYQITPTGRAALKAHKARTRGL